MTFPKISLKCGNKKCFYITCRTVSILFIMLGEIKYFSESDYQISLCSIALFVYLMENVFSGQQSLCENLLDASDTTLVEVQ